MSDILFLNPVYNNGILFCDENIVFFFSLISLFAGMLTCYQGTIRPRFCFGVIFTCLFGYLMAVWLPGLYPRTQEAVLWELLLYYVLFFIMLWGYGHLAWFVSGWIERKIKQKSSDNVRHLMIIMTVAAGIGVTLFFGNRMLLFSPSADLLSALFLGMSGISYQNWKMNQKPLFYPTYPKLLKMGRGKSDEIRK